MISRFTVTPLLYACGALLALSIGLGIALKVQGSKVDAAQSAQAAAESARDAANTERDAWKLRAEDNARAANTAQGNVATLRTELTRAQGDLRTLGDQSRRAIAQAEAERADAERTLDLFTARYQTESRKPDCTRALEAVGRSCPALEGY